MDYLQPAFLSGTHIFDVGTTHLIIDAGIRCVGFRKMRKGKIAETTTFFCPMGEGAIVSWSNMSGYKGYIYPNTSIAAIKRKMSSSTSFRP